MRYCSHLLLQGKRLFYVQLQLLSQNVLFPQNMLFFRTTTLVKLISLKYLHLQAAHVLEEAIFLH